MFELAALISGAFVAGLLACGRTTTFNHHTEGGGGRVVRFVCVLLLLIGCGTVVAQEIDEVNASEDLLNWAFATRLGSGIYHVSGRTVQIYRFPISFTPIKLEGRSFGLKVKLPVTLGFYDFKPSDIIEEGLPDRVNTLSFVPGVEFSVPIKENWTLFPILDAGFGMDFDGDESVGIFSVALKSRALFPGKQFDVLLGNEVAYTRQTRSVQTSADDFASFEAGVEVRHDLGAAFKGHDLDYGMFFNSFFYFDTLEFLVPGGGSIDVSSEYELGVTFGTKEPYRVLGIKMPRIGLSWRRGDNVGALRFILGNAL